MPAASPTAPGMRREGFRCSGQGFGSREGVWPLALYLTDSVDVVGKLPNPID